MKSLSLFAIFVVSAVLLTSCGGSGDGGNTTVNKGLPALSVKAGTGGERTRQIVFTVRLGEVSVDDVTFMYSTSTVSDASAAQQEDFVAILEREGMITTGMKTLDIVVEIMDDGIVENNEIFSLVLSDVKGAIFIPTGETLTAKGTIIDNIPDANANGLIDISTAEQLNNIRYNVAGTSYKTSETDTDDFRGCPGQICSGYELLNDIDLLSLSDFIPIQGPDVVDASIDKSECESNLGVWDVDTNACTYATPFSAVFSGKGYTISKLNISSNANFVGFFGVFSGMVNDLNLRNGSITYTGTKSYGVGAVVGRLERAGIVDKVSSDLTVIGTHKVGGLVGVGYGIVRNSYATGDVNGTGMVGGLVGYNTRTIKNSYATGDVDDGDGNYGDVGGLVGNSTGKIQNSYALGAVNGGAGSDIVGGLVGYLSNTIQNSYALGAVNGGDGNGDRVGGLVGESYGKIMKSYALGAVNGGGGNRDKVGRILGNKSAGTIFGNYYLSTSNFEGEIERPFGNDEAVGKTVGELKALTADVTETEFADDNNGWSIKDWGFTNGKYPSLRSYKVDGNSEQIRGGLLCDQGVNWGQGDEWIHCTRPSSL